MPGIACPVYVGSEIVGFLGTMTAAFPIRKLKPFNKMVMSPTSFQSMQLTLAPLEIFYLLGITDPRCTGGNNGCCSPATQCKIAEGPCNGDSDCTSGKCGFKNCDKITFPSFANDDNCCMEASGEMIVAALSGYLIFQKKNRDFSCDIE